MIVWDMPPTNIRVCFTINMQCITIVKSMVLFALMIKSLGLIALIIKSLGSIALIIKSLGSIVLLICGPWLKGEVGTSSAPPADLLSPQLLHMEINKGIIENFTFKKF